MVMQENDNYGNNIVDSNIGININGDDNDNNTDINNNCKNKMYLEPYYLFENIT